MRLEYVRMELTSVRQALAGKTRFRSYPRSGSVGLHRDFDEVQSFCPHGFVMFAAAWMVSPAVCKSVIQKLTCLMPAPLVPGRSSRDATISTSAPRGA
jgi:hypothetical protein